jgi:hypothetical protein
MTKSIKWCPRTEKGRSRLDFQPKSLFCKAFSFLHTFSNTTDDKTQRVQEFLPAIRSIGSNAPVTDHIRSGPAKGSRQNSIY